MSAVKEAVRRLVSHLVVDSGGSRLARRCGQGGDIRIKRTGGRDSGKTGN